jgi:hypothetical protein
VFMIIKNGKMIQIPDFFLVEIGDIMVLKLSS